MNARSQTRSVIYDLRSLVSAFCARDATRPEQDNETQWLISDAAINAQRTKNALYVLVVTCV